MASQSSNNSNNRQRSGGGNRSNSNNNRNRNRNRNNNNNRNRNRNSNDRGGRRRKPAPKLTTGQKILSFLTFGLLGKPKKRTQHPKKKRSNSSPQPKPAAKHQRRPRPEISSARLYVGNLSYDAEDEELETLFHGAGNVISAEVVRNSKTQQSKGFAFVEMGSLAEAKRAVDILDDQDFMGRRLRISSARSDGPRDSDEEEGDDSPAASPEENDEAPVSE